ncbi:MAG: VWA domain-containing protein [Gammaproteobacteria bacterium]|nr:VWA domain-containing protein [Gammaproteobacteria bacterium]
MRKRIFAKPDLIQLSPRRPLAGRAFMVPILIALLWLLTPNALTAATQQDDIRVLIDISGSMRHTDPNNLRVPALRLFVSLLPHEAHAGVWTFGQWVNMLIAHGPVDKAWKTGARKAVREINSRGLFTNIEDAIRRASWDWKKPALDQRRSMILLTDGLVDISQDPDVNAASRERVLNELLPQLQAAGVVVHTIALSADSDHKLLRQLASATGGRFETIEDTEGLERLFLRLFEKVADTDHLPLVDNKVKVDNSIREVTFLVFRGKKTSEDTSITPPSGKKFNQTKLPKNVGWHREARYDLVTVQNPKPGTWRINADVDPDNRVMVVTDLKLKTTALPNTLAADTPVIFEAHLEEHGNIITRQDFLHFVRVKLNQYSTDDKMNEKKWKQKLLDNGKAPDKKAHDGIYTTQLKETLVNGEHELEIAVNGTTFKRHARQLVQVLSEPVEAQIEATPDDHIIVTVIPYKELIDADAMRIVATQTLPNGELVEHRVPRVSTAEWQLKLDASTASGKHDIILHIIGNRADGSEVDTTLTPLSIHIGEAPETEAIPETISDAEQPAEHNDDHEAEEHSPEAETAVETNWLMVSLRVLLFNILLVAIGFGIYKMWPKATQRLFPNPGEELAHG